MSTTAALRVDGLQVVRGGRAVVRDVSFGVDAGSVTGLLGPSGCGKTSLMRAIVGVQARVTGTCDVLGRPAGDPALRHLVGYVTQAPAVYPDLTVRENVAYFAVVVGAARSDVDRVLDEVVLRDEADMRADTLSGGQLSRVSLATALLGTPRLLVLDEPTVGLDPVLRRDLWDMFRRLADDGVALLVSSHVMDEASRCHRLVLMRDGMIVADDTEAGLIARTGADDVEGAFLAIVESDRGDAGTA
ncbi:MAG: ABC transporter ATP-binding protein [Actinomycetes bacterium]